MQHITALLEKQFLIAQRRPPGATYESVSYLLGTSGLQTEKEKSEKETGRIASMFFWVVFMGCFHLLVFFFLQF